MHSRLSEALTLVSESQAVTSRKSPGQRAQRVQRPWGCSVPGVSQDWEQASVAAGQWSGTEDEGDHPGPVDTARTLSSTPGIRAATGRC